MGDENDDVSSDSGPNGAGSREARPGEDGHEAQQLSGEIPPRPVNRSVRKSPKPNAAPASIVRFLYTQNPFYLISCFLIIYGLQGIAVSSGDLLNRSIAMSGGIAAYTILMTVICIAVVRCCRVWDDARSIFLVVLISLIALSTGFDQLCIENNRLGSGFASVAGILTIVVIESLLYFSRVRLTRWYRACLYALFVVFLGSPVLFGRAVEQRNDALANWGSLIFSIAIAASLLLLIPAVRQGRRSVRRNRTPWRWPLFPLAAFFVVLVLAGIRAHAIWISFGFYGIAGKFEPFLLLPMLAATLWLIAECGLGQERHTLQRTAIFGAPVLLLCGLSNHGMTWLPMRDDLQLWFGSGWTASMAAVLCFYFVMTVRRVRFAEFGIPAILMLGSLTADVPRVAAERGFELWMLSALAAIVLTCIAAKRMGNDWVWTLAAGNVSVAIAMAFHTYAMGRTGAIVATAFAIGSMMVIGAVFKTPLAQALRVTAAVALVAGTLFCTQRYASGTEAMVRQPWPWLIAAACAFSAGYAIMVHRKGWVFLSVLHAMLFVALISWGGFREGHLKKVNWPISSGLLCLAVGLAITTGKTGAYKRWGHTQASKSWWTKMESGL